MVVVVMLVMLLVGLSCVAMVAGRWSMAETVAVKVI